MLPRAAYVDPAVFDWEQRHFFGGGWMCVARSEQLPQPGDQRAEATGQGGVLLVRGEDGELVFTKAPAEASASPQNSRSFPPLPLRAA